MARNRKQRRQQHGSAWHWRQTNWWYYTRPVTKKQLPLFDEKGEQIQLLSQIHAMSLGLMAGHFE